jgi:RimJ/RimL family protein N-acetyltransferase
MHGKGVATILLAELVRAARLRGIARFRADVIADNAPMRAILDRVGATPVASECEGGTIAYDLSLPELDAAAPRKSVLWILVEVLRGAAETMAVRFRARRL